MSDENTTVIVGAGIAGVHAAESLRTEGYQGRVVLMDRDRQMPYDRPPLSKEWLTGKMDEASMLLRDPAIYEKLDIDLQLGVDVTDVDPVRKTIAAKDGSSYDWDKLLLATGSSLRTLSIAGDDLQGIFYLRRMADAIAIKQHMQHVNEVVIIGAGFIGAELASSLKQLGMDVTIVERSLYPMEAIVGRDISAFLLNLHDCHGVNVIFDDSVVQFNGESTVEEAVTAGGQRIPCRAVMIGVGATPNTVVSHPDLEADGGYAVNEFGETSIPDIFAAGDCTLWPYRGTPIRVEHWDHAVNHAKTVAQNILQPQSSPYTYIPYFWSDQHGSRFQYFGHAKQWTKTVLRGSLESHAFTNFYLDEHNRVQAAFIANQPKNALPVRRMIKQQQVIDPEALADESVALKKMKHKTRI
ncbi:3-phenylpropionate/trans-cinnamate dioxygenase ferredoxin reductase subunit [Lentibacillus persicus]|uniref:3-phenylpropionate/trans-cinnamate dioxygenase ferredoxin reductase subunit n=1 Tax=Lentibacillus persicus TaxID=640948 RepID=A0A1I1W5H5_9BACI|nr:FAD-dependent oxidoreductase [Lentibacillus persicus]SFD89668.1 3-phenylpropionate/trans-cinnamate dioxygenase ferredoxin reductase subunit [Lentibacillus persicus]